MRERLKGDTVHYTSKSMFYDDLVLMCRNALLYNNKGTDYHRCVRPNLAAHLVWWCANTKSRPHDKASAFCKNLHLRGYEVVYVGTGDNIRRPSPECVSPFPSLHRRRVL